ncbi:F-box protein At4g22280-like [Carex rostrata]
MMNTNCCGSEKTDDIDRISSLPDDIRTHILSFLSTREAVQTCILSKRWINSWAYAPDLKFDIGEFELPDFENFYEDVAVEFVTKFELLMKSVLEKRETSCANIFQLWLHSGAYWPRTQVVNNCIDDAMKLGPQECSIILCSCENLNLNTDLIFTCASLTYLQLWLFTHAGPFVAIEPNSINLPCLKILNLDGVIMSDDSFKNLLLGCPVLEELVLENCCIGIIEICSNTLKNLVLHSCFCLIRLKISTPNLLYLNILVVTKEIILLNMLSLVNASISVPSWYDHDKYITRGRDLIHNLSNVESLQLEFNYPEGKAPKKDFSDCPVFNNLKCVKLLSYGLYDFDLAPFFLLHSPKLQELILENKHGRVTEFLEDETALEGPRDALVQREFLKTVRIVGFQNDNGFVDRLINMLLIHVKIIGDIVIDP